MAIDNMMPGSGLPAPVEAEGILPAEEESYYESIGFPLLIELLSKAQTGTEAERLMSQGQPQMMGQAASRFPRRSSFEHIKSRDSQGRPSPNSRLEAMSNLLRAKRSRVSNPGPPNLPRVAEVVNQRMASRPQQMPSQQMPSQQMPRQAAPQRPNRMQQARRPEVYKPLRQQPAPQSNAGPMQAFNTNQAR